MTLSGNLEYFPLEEVLRLLARSQQTGCLEVVANGRGRVYFEGGGISFASAEPSEVLTRSLVAAGIARADRIAGVEAAGGSLTDVVEGQDRYSAIVREFCVEGLFRVQSLGGAPFEFQVGARPRPATGVRYDVEILIDEARRRAAEWAEIETVVPDLTTPWRMVPELGEDSVTIGDVAWRVLAALEGGCSVEGLAERIGITRFQAAQRMAELSRARLVEMLGVSTAAVAADTWEEPAPTASVEPAAAEEAAFVDRSWWEEPAVATAPPAAPEAASGSEEGAAEGDEFLETVFNELDKSEEQSEQAEETGFGLLRRRGLGSAFRELADS